MCEQRRQVARRALGEQVRVVVTASGRVLFMWQFLRSVDDALGCYFRKARTFVQPFMETVLTICGSNLSP